MEFNSQYIQRPAENHPFQHAEQSGYKNQRPTAVSRAQKREGGVPRQSLIRLGAVRHKHRIR
ncbi:uncharacterized protein PADG_12390 [Paracoccidioides brasiliensis Pb18]|uniref:Uncharacterized protein n=1 Tax=Paracoccidioides brasiliensis (strain Pb18) TaxID=502780 RepID=A0A0A0HS97_PARBD|nr:uncharacterized protein PADG_12390 [Paracoccidioides brasiliensis Pb18]KGM91532.1 hypothetical protein PADG_12390 [Paracoccidioides brasiliensis Pb18]